MKAILAPKNNSEEKHCSQSTIVATMTKSKTTICKLQTTSPSRQGFEKKTLESISISVIKVSPKKRMGTVLQGTITKNYM